MDKHVTNLPLSRKLAAAFKEKGIKPPESEFYWHEITVDGKTAHYLSQDASREDWFDIWIEHGGTSYPAYLCVELLNEMPSTIPESENHYLALGIDKYDGMWAVGYGIMDDVNYIKSLPNACASMILWLIDNGYYEPPT